MCVTLYTQLKSKFAMENKITNQFLWICLFKEAKFNLLVLIWWKNQFFLCLLACSPFSVWEELIVALLVKSHRKPCHDCFPEMLLDSRIVLQHRMMLSKKISHTFMCRAADKNNGRFIFHLWIVTKVPITSSRFTKIFLVFCNINGRGQQHSIFFFVQLQIWAISAPMSNPRVHINEQRKQPERKTHTNGKITLCTRLVQH